MSLVGNLADLGLGEILQIVSLSRKTGILSLHSGDREGSVVFRQGLVVRAASSTFQQSLGKVLIQKGVIDLAVLRKALALQQEDGFRERLGVILIKNFGISHEIVEEVVREQIENVVFTLFTWIEGSFEFVASEHIETVDGTRLDPLQFMLDQGLNPQFLAMEGSRLLNENNLAAETGSAVRECVSGDGVDFDLGSVRHSSASSMPAPKMPLIIIDDDGPTLQAIADGMRQQGYDVHAMTRSEDTLIKVDALCRGGEHPTVLVDLIMPKMDGSGVLGGVELLELLHANFKNIPIVVMTDYHHADAEIRVRDMGYAFIMKPRRVELGDSTGFQNFLGLLCDEVQRSETGEEMTEWQEHFNLGDEMRIEMGVDDEVPISEEPESNSGLSLLRGMLEELNNPELQGGPLLLALRFASEFLNRAIVFTVHDKVVSGAGQFGISGGKVSGDEKVRAIHFPLEVDSMFHDPSRTCHAVTFMPHPTPLDNYIFEQLGGGIPEEAFIGPLVSQSRVIGFLYGDNLPEKQAIGDTESLSIFLSQAGIAMEKNMLEKQLHERSNT
ncbi:MAG: response regulator [Verrucomicrobia bacterium]|nr:response regulator [Deltaproteobacteria bacterium]